MSRVPSRGGSFAPAPRRGIFFVYCVDVLVGVGGTATNALATRCCSALVASESWRAAAAFTRIVCVRHRGTRQQTTRAFTLACAPGRFGDWHRVVLGILSMVASLRIVLVVASLFALGDSLPFFPQACRPRSSR